MRPCCSVGARDRLNLPRGISPGGSERRRGATSPAWRAFSGALAFRLRPLRPRARGHLLRDSPMPRRFMQPGARAWQLASTGDPLAPGRVGMGNPTPLAGSCCSLDAARRSSGFAAGNAAAEAFEACRSRSSDAALIQLFLTESPPGSPRVQASGGTAISRVGRSGLFLHAPTSLSQSAKGAFTWALAMSGRRRHWLLPFHALQGVAATTSRGRWPGLFQDGASPSGGARESCNAPDQEDHEHEQAGPRSALGNT